MKYTIVVLSLNARGQQYERRFQLTDWSAFSIDKAGVLFVSGRINDMPRQHYFSPSGWLECWVETEEDK